jgi:cobalamin biosynthesis protein CobT
MRVRHMSFFRRLLGLDYIDEKSKVVFKERPKPLPNPPDGYRIYTTEFDETIRSTHIPVLIEQPTPAQAEEFAESKRKYRELSTVGRGRILKAAGIFTRRLLSQRSPEERSTTVVTILIDHSGSMRGEGMLSACLAAEEIWRTLDRCGVPTEIIGFTTRSWKGGQSRVKWIMEGRPANPGRLCDVRYILYRTAEDRRGGSPDFSHALHSGLLKENIDGEAILYAAQRLEGDEWAKKAIVVLSDGAPVDDSTLASNADESILAAHLNQVIGEVSAIGIGVGYVTLKEWPRFLKCDNSAVALAPVDAAEVVFEVAAKALGLDPACSELDPLAS